VVTGLVVLVQHERRPGHGHSLSAADVGGSS